MGAKKWRSTSVLQLGLLILCIGSVASTAALIRGNPKNASPHEAAPAHPRLVRVSLYGSGFAFGKTTISMGESQITYIGRREREGGGIEFGSFSARLSPTDIETVRATIQRGGFRTFSPSLSWFKKDWAKREIMLNSRFYLVLSWSDKEVVLYIPPPPYVYEGLKDKARVKAYEHLYDLECIICQMKSRYLRSAEWKTYAKCEEEQLREKLQDELRDVDMRSLPQGRKGW